MLFLSLGMKRNGVNVTGNLKLNKNIQLEVETIILMEGELLVAVRSLFCDGKTKEIFPLYNHFMIWKWRLQNQSRVY
jgi:hypothetical protein